uniref:Uncharacterized protein n=1 Tax=Cacopsylla melanoneura TaxID=428564 RepID=A0A8D9E3C8_9HEMI
MLNPLYSKIFPYKKNSLMSLKAKMKPREHSNKVSKPGMVESVKFSEKVSEISLKRYIFNEITKRSLGVSLKVAVPDVFHFPCAINKESIVFECVVHNVK